jgi:hypothetical protein
MECGKTFTKSNPTADSKCPGCGGSDLELANGKANGKDIDPQKLAEMVVDEIPASQMTESACVSFALEKGYSRADGELAWRIIFREMKAE